MHVRILGTRGEVEEFSEEHRKYSGIMIDDVLFDLGEPEYLNEKPRAIFVSHLHPDHFFPLRKKESVKDIKIEVPIYSLEKPEGNFDWRALRILKPVVISGLRIIPIPTYHSRKVKSCAFLIKGHEKRVLYTSDMIWINKRYHNLIRGVDLVIADGSYKDENGMVRRDKETGEVWGHTGIPRLVRLFKNLGAKQVVFTHFGTWMMLNPHEGKNFIRSIDDALVVKAARDGERVMLSVVTSESISDVTKPVQVQVNPLTCLYLVPPHASLIASGEKKLIVETREFTEHIDEPLYLLEDGLCYGIIRLKQPVKMTYEDVTSKYALHRITPEEMKEWGWNSGDTFYGYEFVVEEVFDPPQPVQVPKGTQVFVQADKVKFLNWSELSITSLVSLSDKDNLSLTLNVLEEMKRRNMLECALLVKEASETWVSDYIGNLKNYSTRQLMDDFRIVLAWYSAIRQGKELFKHLADGRRKQISVDDCKKLVVEITRELISRGVTFNRPETYRKHARELFEYVVSQIGKDSIPWKLAFDPKSITRESLETIDPPLLKTLTDDELLMLHARLHEIYSEIGSVPEPLENAHIFVWEEIRERKLGHEIVDELDRRSALEVVEYPQINLGQNVADVIRLEEVLKSFPDKIVVEEPIHVYLCGRVVNEGAIPSSHDIDLLFKQSLRHDPTVGAFLEAIAKQDREVASRLHFVWDPHGPQIGYTVPLYRLAFVKVGDEEMKRTAPYQFLSGKPQLFRPYVGLKPKSGFEKNEFWDTQEMWDKWAVKYIDSGIVVQKKYDGMRFQIHVKGDVVKIFTEDRRRDRASFFSESVKELLASKKADSFILDAEMVEYFCDKESSELEYCEPLEREQMIKWIASDGPLDDKCVVFHIHDCLLVNNEPLNQKGYKERWETIKNVISDCKHWKRVDGGVAYDMRSFFYLVKKYRSLPGSEGVVAKVVDSKYPIKYSGENRTEEWAKLKNLKEIDVLVWKVVQKKTKDGKPLDQYMYECVFSIPCEEKEKYSKKDIVMIGNKCYLYIGRTYSTAEKVRAGDVITVRPIRVAEFRDTEGKLRYTWMFPYFDGKHAVKTEPDSIDVVKKLVAVGTGPLPEQLNVTIYRLPTCPFWNDDTVCPLKCRFARPRDNLSRVMVEVLKYPILCRFANHFKCRYVKSYYYGYKEIADDRYVDEDTGEVEDENHEKNGK